MDKIKVLRMSEDAVLPSKANTEDAGYDLVAIDNGTVGKEGYIEYRTGIAIDPPPGYHTEIVPRSSISKYDLALANSIGIVDNPYRGEIKVRFRPTGEFYDTSAVGGFTRFREMAKLYKKGDKIAQLIIRKTESAPFEWAEALSDTSRGVGGFGSSGS